MSDIDAGAAELVGTPAGGGAAAQDRIAELEASLDGARRKVIKQRDFLAAAEAEVARLEEELAEVSGDGVVGE